MTNEERLSEAYSDMKVLYWELKHSTNAKGIHLQHEILKGKYSDRLRKIEELEEVVKNYKQQLKECKTQIQELKELVPVEYGENEVVVVILNRHEIGKYVPQKKYQKVLEESRMWAEKYKETIKIKNT